VLVRVQSLQGDLKIVSLLDFVPGRSKALLGLQGFAQRFRVVPLLSKARKAGRIGSQLQ
jgi:hypothetical protein